MTAIERLHKLLDERGVEYEDAYGITLWTGADGCAYTAIEMVPLSMKPSKKLMVRRILTPEQAIVATLGPGTCCDEGTFSSWRLFTCSHCSVVFPIDAIRDAPSIGRVIPPKFCPNCGRKVVDG